MTRRTFLLVRDKYLKFVGRVNPRPQLYRKGAFVERLIARKNKGIEYGRYRRFHLRGKRIDNEVVVKEIGNVDGAVNDAHAVNRRGQLRENAGSPRNDAKRRRK